MIADKLSSGIGEKIQEIDPTQINEKDEPKIKRHHISNSAYY